MKSGLHGKLSNLYKHGAYKTKLYKIWKGMRQRCNDPNKSNYKYYGGRGIKVCARWDNFLLFAQDIGECPLDMFLDRIDNNGDYEPDNVRWVDRSTQMKNTRRAKK